VPASSTSTSIAGSEPVEWSKSGLKESTRKATAQALALEVPLSGSHAMLSSLSYTTAQKVVARSASMKRKHFAGSLRALLRRWAVPELDGRQLGL
jgi:hypothetical protein